MTKQYLIRVEHPGALVEMIYASGTLIANDEDDRPQDAACRAVRSMHPAAKAITAVIDQTGKLVTRSAK